MKVFIAALDWGLGHTTRIMPLINQLINENHQLVIGCSELQKKIYKDHFTGLTYTNIVSSAPVLGGKKSQAGSYIRFVPGFLFSMVKENKQLRKLDNIHHFDIVLSDNRYGLYLPGRKNVLITHQLNIILPPGLKQFTAFTNRIIHKWINRFDFCIVPDYMHSVRLSGRLSDIFSGCMPQVKFIGPLSRFQFVKEKKTVVPELLIIISGPEKQRTVFEKIIDGQLNEVGKKFSFLVVMGKPLAKNGNRKGFKNHLRSDELKYLIRNSTYIICRSGYSTIMDLVYLGRTALLVPTPGQSEQEYLAGQLSKQGWFIMENQKGFNLKSAIERLRQFNPRPFEWTQKSIESFSI